MNYQELKKLIQQHNIAYYDKAAPTITDSEWDQLYDKLEAMEKAQGWRDHDSPTKLVGGAAGKVTHPYKLYSLRKVYDKEETKSTHTLEKTMTSDFIFVSVPTPANTDGSINLDIIYECFEEMNRVNKRKNNVILLDVLNVVNLVIYQPIVDQKLHKI